MTTGVIRENATALLYLFAVSNDLATVFVRTDVRVNRSIYYAVSHGAGGSASPLLLPAHTKC